MRIACLHTAESNVAIFEAARPDGVSLSHAVRPDLLAAAEADGLTPAIAAATAEVLGALRGGAGGVPARAYSGDRGQPRPADH